MNKLTVVLACHNRVEVAVEAIESILQQSSKDFDFIISDNSSNNLLLDIIKDRFPSVKYLSQSSSGLNSFFAHFNSIISSVDTEYVVVFHDDDIMLPNFIDTVLNNIKSHKDAAAIATNGVSIDIDGNDIYDSKVFDKNDKLIKFYSKSDILRQYLAWDFGRAAPFCSYAYNIEKIKGLELDYKRGRKYCDTVFLMDILERGDIVWINECLVKVRIHANHISSSCGVLDYKAFLYIVKNEVRDYVDIQHIKEYRFRNLYYALKRINRWPLPALKYFLFNIFKVMFYSKSFRRFFVLKIASYFKLGKNKKHFRVESAL